MDHSNSEGFRRRRNCILPLAVALATTWGIGHATEQTDDASLKSQVQAALNGDSSIFARHIEVSVKGGVVRLTGFVQKQTELDQAKKDAAAVPGVKSVKNEMTLKHNETGASH